MSGQQVTASGPLHATERARAFMARLGARSADELLAMPAERLVEGLDATDPDLGGGVYMGPVLDMKWLVRHPFWPDANPQGNAIPMMLGNTHDETRAFYPPDHPRIVGPELGQSRRADGAGAPHRRPAGMGGRRISPAVSRLFARADLLRRDHRRAELARPGDRGRGARPAPASRLRLSSSTIRTPAPHAADIPLVFGTYADPAVAAGQRGDDGGLHCASPAPAIPAGRPTRLPARRTMIFDRTPHMASDPRRAERELFARIPYIQPGT